MKWILVFTVVLTASFGDVCKAKGMRRLGEIDDFRDGDIVLRVSETSLHRSSQFCGSRDRCEHCCRDRTGAMGPQRNSELAAMGWSGAGYERRGLASPVIAAILVA